MRKQYKERRVSFIKSFCGPEFFNKRRGAAAEGRAQFCRVEVRIRDTS